MGNVVIAINSNNQYSKEFVEKIHIATGHKDKRKITMLKYNVNASNVDVYVLW
jgi:hypothetical protein